LLTQLNLLVAYRQVRQTSKLYRGSYQTTYGVVGVLTFYKLF
jgi:hypothetical protein